MVSQVGSTSMMQAPLGYSYRCLAPKKYTMVPIDGAADNATLLFTQYQFQSYLQDETSFGEGKIEPYLHTSLSNSSKNRISIFFSC